MTTQHKISRVTIVGAGVLGHSIAQKFASEGYEVLVVDNNPDNLQQAKAQIDRNLDALAQADLLRRSPQAIRENLSYFDDLTKAVDKVDLVIEAVTENLEVKRQLLATIEELTSEQTIIASNASSLVPSEYNQNVQDKTRVLGAHFFNPPHLLPLVELVYGPETADEVKTCMHQTLSAMGMHPIGVHKETPGFIGNRLQFALLKEAIAIVQEGVASPEDVDKVVKYGFGRRLSVMGPFEVFDFGGWDTIARVHPNITGEATPKEILDKVAQGKYGVKTGEGFYRWTPEKEAEKRALINNIYTYLEQVVNRHD